MFFDSFDDILKISKKVGFSIFAVDEIPNLKIKNAIYLHPDEKTNKITIDSAREILNLTTTKKPTSQFIIIEYPEQMTPETGNAFLKNLEEPKENYHFIFLTKNLTSILPTILSRAQIYYKRTSNILEKPLNVSEEIKDLAKELIVANEKNLINLAKKISDKKDRKIALEIISTSIEISYKSFLLTNDIKFLKKIPKLLNLYENINKNGNLKLHIVADLI